MNVLMENFPEETRSASQSDRDFRPSPISPVRKLILISIALFGLTFLVFLPATRNEFVNFDDTVYVTENPHVQSGLTLANLKWAMTTGHGGNWHPLTWLSHMVDCQIYGSK